MFVLTYVGSVWKNTGQLGDPRTLRNVYVRSICAMLPVSKQTPWMNRLNKSLAGYGFLIWNCEYGFLIWNCEAFFFFLKLHATQIRRLPCLNRKYRGKKSKAISTVCQALWSSLMVSSSEDTHTVITIHRVRGLVEHARKIGRRWNKTALPPWLMALSGREVRAGSSRKELKQRPWRNTGCWLSPQGLLSLFSSSSHGHLPRDGSPHLHQWSELLTSIINQEYAAKSVWYKSMFLLPR